MENVLIFFYCHMGLRQRDILLLLRLLGFINAFERFLRNKCNDLTSLKTFVEEYLGAQQTQTFLNLLVLLYADNTIILSESEEDMRKTLQTVSDYCKTSNLIINCDKAKVMSFARGKARNAE